MSQSSLNKANVDQLVVKILGSIQPFLTEGATLNAFLKNAENNRLPVYETLNALAISVATIVHGTESIEALEFFSLALNINLKGMQKDKPWKPQDSQPS
jgi:hypothetical protein